MNISAEDFEGFLSALDPNHDLAGRKYVQLRDKLIKFFALKGFTDAEDLADETFNRAARKFAEIRDSYEGNLQAYVYGVARLVSMQSKRTITPVRDFESLITPEKLNELEDADMCLQHCLGKLSPETQNLILRYYEGEKWKMIENRKALANELGLSANALRIRSHQIRTTLEKCMRECLQKRQA
jgi:DNA-directed RNA polymerase specialized sigma24 family protein